MIVDAPRTEDRDGRVERSARVRWSDGELRVRVELPEGHAGPADDLSAFLALALLPAMRRHEDLALDAAVSPLLLARTDELQSFYHGWDPSLRRCDVRAEASRASTPAGDRSNGAFFSRGVDSMYSAMAERDQPLERLVFSTNHDPIHGPATQVREAELAAEAASALGLPIDTVSSNVRELTEPILNWADAHGAGLAFLALSLEGGFRRLTIPSWADYESLGACGSHPLLDLLFSTERVEVAHDSIAHGRLEKVGVLARERPDVLPLLKVCFRVDTPANCGRCTKCLWTMCCLHVHGALGRATLFPAEVDVGAVARVRLNTRVQRVFWQQVMRALPASDPLHGAIAEVLRRSAHPTVWQRVRGRLRQKERLDLMPPPWDAGGSAFFRHDTNRAVSVLRDGRPYP